MLEISKLRVLRLCADCVFPVLFAPLKEKRVRGEILISVFENQQLACASGKLRFLFKVYFEKIWIFNPQEQLYSCSGAFTLIV